MTLLGLGIHIPGLASALASGAPQLGAGAATGTVGTAWNTGRAAAYGAVAAASGVNRVYSWVSGPPPSSGGGGSPSVRPSPSGGGGSSSGGGGSPSGGGGSIAPAWARRMSQSLHAGRAAGQSLRSGDRPGAPTSVNLRGEDR
jgi:type IV secretion system protein TrbL